MLAMLLPLLLLLLEARGEKAWLDENGVEYSLNAPEGLVQSVS